MVYHSQDDEESLDFTLKADEEDSIDFQEQFLDSLKEVKLMKLLQMLWRINTRLIALGEKFCKLKSVQNCVTQMRTCSIREEDVVKGDMKAEMELGNREYMRCISYCEIRLLIYFQLNLICSCS